MPMLRFRKHWIVLFLLFTASIFFWYKLSYPFYEFVNIAVSRSAAVQCAEKFLNNLGVNISQYQDAVVFDNDWGSNRYLQKTLGLEKSTEFIKEHGIDLFNWRVRFFQENQKEEFIVGVSAKTEKVIYYYHILEDTALRPDNSKETSFQIAQNFFTKNYGLQFSDFRFHSEQIKRFDKRIDYSFTWEKKGVYIPWCGEENGGGAKLLIDAVVTGNEIKSFSCGFLDIPEKFQRNIERQMVVGDYLTLIVSFINIFWIVVAYLVINAGKNAFVIRRSFKVYLRLSFFYAFLYILYRLNNFQNIVMQYSTNTSFMSYLGYYATRLIPVVLFLSFPLTVVALAGEFLRLEQFPANKKSSLYQNIISSFMNRGITKQIMAGYGFAVVLLGLQAVMYWVGRKYFSVWSDRYRFPEFSTAVIPFFTALFVSAEAAFREEIFYRLFAITWFKKYLKHTVCAVFFAALVWGIGHTGYYVFPVWFRGIEVTILGICMGFVYLRYGLIATLIAHYLFNAFIGIAPYLFGKSSSYLLGSSLLILFLPALVAVIAALINKPCVEKKAEMLLDRTQKNIIDVLIVYLNDKKEKGILAEAACAELLAHDWDRVLVQIAVKRVYSDWGKAD